MADVSEECGGERYRGEGVWCAGGWAGEGEGESEWGEQKFARGGRNNTKKSKKDPAGPLRASEKTNPPTGPTPPIEHPTKLVPLLPAGQCGPSAICHLCLTACLVLSSLSALPSPELPTSRCRPKISLVSGQSRHLLPSPLWQSLRWHLPLVLQTLARLDPILRLLCHALTCSLTSLRAGIGASHVESHDTIQSRVCCRFGHVRNAE